ncbi:CHAT domain-containing protein [Streptomyces sp. NPDC056468]|uniref:CHAT domain-containing protein n=1 Tax=Streptomyces sp. NPDC056468 TaxID=3345830 RepID=UPI0036CBB11A
MEILTSSPHASVLVNMAKQADWSAWHILLGGHPELFESEFPEQLEAIRSHVHEEDTWVLETLVEFLTECRATGTDAAVARWRTSAHVGAGAALPSEYQLMAAARLADLVGDREDPTAATSLGNLGILLMRRQLGDRDENLRQSRELLEAAVELASTHGDVPSRAQYQQALAHVVMLGENNAVRSLEICEAALEGWRREDDPELWGLVMTSRANCFVGLRRYDEAIADYLASLTVFGRESSPKRWAISTYGLGGAYVSRGLRGGSADDFEQGLAVLQEVSRLRSREQDEMRWAMTEDGLGWCRLLRFRPAERAADLDRAIGHFTAALQVYPPDRPEHARAQHGLGRAYFARFQLAGAPADLLASRTALEAALDTTDAHDLRDVHHHLAEVFLRLGATDPGAQEAAVEHQRSALALVSVDDDPQAWADAAMALAATLITHGSPTQADGHEQAVQYLMAALPVLGSGPQLARALATLGFAWARHPFGGFEELATQALEGALTEITREDEPELWSHVQSSLAAWVIDRESGSKIGDEARQARYAEVLGRLDEALESATSPEGTAHVKAITGEAHLTYGHREAAIAPLEEARDACKELSRADDFARVQLRLARAYGPADPRSFRAALTSRRLTPMEVSPREFGIASEWLAHAHLSQGNQERAGHAYRAVVTARRYALRAAQLPTDQEMVRGWFRDNVAEEAGLCFARAAERTVDEGERQRLLTLAVESIDAGRLNGFPEYAATHLALLATHDPGLHQEYRDATARFQAAGRVDRTFLTGSFLETEPLAVIRDAENWLVDREEARAAWARYKDVLARIQDRTGLDLAVEPLTLAEIAALLDDRAGIAYVMCDDDGSDGTGRPLILLVLPDGTVRMRWCSGGLSEIYGVGAWLPNQFAPEFVPLLRRALDKAFPVIGELVCRPLAEELRDAGIARVHLVACGILNTFPLHACAVDEAQQTPLSEEFDTSYLPSAAVLRSLRARSHRSGRSRMVTVTNPLPNPKPLPHAATQRAEVAKAARTGGAHLVELPEHAATGDAVRTAVAEATHVDFACHGQIHHLYALDSGIELSDGPMVVRDLLDTRMLDGVALVTLTSCQSAVPAGVPFKDEPLSLATGFLIAGAQAVLGTLWRVDDLATALYVGRFYHHLLVDRHPLATALGQAQRWLRELTLADVAAELGDETPSAPLWAAVRPFDHSLYWAPFVLTAD